MKLRTTTNLDLQWGIRVAWFENKTWTTFFPAAVLP